MSRLTCVSFPYCAHTHKTFYYHCNLYSLCAFVLSKSVPTSTQFCERGRSCTRHSSARFEWPRGRVWVWNSKKRKKVIAYYYYYYTRREGWFQFRSQLYIDIARVPGLRIISPRGGLGENSIFRFHKYRNRPINAWATRSFESREYILWFLVERELGEKKKTDVPYRFPRFTDFSDDPSSLLESFTFELYEPSNDNLYRYSGYLNFRPRAISEHVFHSRDKNITCTNTITGR